MCPTPSFSFPLLGFGLGGLLFPNGLGKSGGPERRRLEAEGIGDRTEKMSTPHFPRFLVEEADVGIGADGWDNFLLYDDLTELEEYLEALRYLNAPKCATVVKELLDLVEATRPARTNELLNSHKEQLENLWERCNEASSAESPQELSKKAFMNQ
ncbi:hypothetical protein OKA05_00865 [Luteolibacter arcticus]|uniref:Uncharacterized protein n=1 Tax=Luteolibacter arcticus TaxID=1581411 RepID=A0ABT3GBU1_9BACT|nr:hypothetical protein [Luteolibacter arcticus]MCW1921082.1 hypothetical protein [Luteolibacter arcticus]